MKKLTTGGQERMLAALIEAHGWVSKSVYNGKFPDTMAAGVDIAAARLTAHGVLPRELLDAYVAATMGK